MGIGECYRGDQWEFLLWGTQALEGGGVSDNYRTEADFVLKTDVIIQNHCSSLDD